MNAQNKEKGFTIIEVVLVLAIAGLIFLMVFIALPALQRNQRDSARKNEVSAVASAIESYRSNNRGGTPTATQIGQYITGNANATLDSGAVVVTRTGPTGGGSITTTANVSAGTNPTAPAVSGDTIVVYTNAKCGTGAAIVAGTTRQTAIVTALESGAADGIIYCQTN